MKHLPTLIFLIAPMFLATGQDCQREFDRLMLAAKNTAMDFESRYNKYESAEAVGCDDEKKSIAQAKKGELFKEINTLRAQAVAARADADAQRQQLQANYYELELLKMEGRVRDSLLIVLVEEKLQAEMAKKEAVEELLKKEKVENDRIQEELRKKMEQDALLHRQELERAAASQARADSLSIINEVFRQTQTEAAIELLMHKKIPESLKGLDLEYIKFDSCGLKKIPDQFFQPRSLRSLFLAKNEISEISVWIGQLKGLEVMDLSHNKLTELPDAGFFKLQQLQFIDLSHNLFKSFPLEITYLKQLSRVDLSHNQIETFPLDLIQMKALKTLNLSNNMIRALPDDMVEMVQLQRLNLSGNEIEYLPFRIAELKNLESLNLAGTKLKYLPKDIAQMTNLKSLDISNTGLDKLPPGLKEMKWLSYLNLTNNPFSRKYISSLRKALPATEVVF